METWAFLERYFKPDMLIKSLSASASVADYLDALDPSRPIFAAYNRFLSADERYLDDGKLVIMEEAQLCCFWGVNPEEMRKRDLEIYSAENVEGSLVWEVADHSFHDFIKSMLFWQAVNGGWEYFGSAKVAKKMVAALSRELTILEVPPRDTGLQLFEVSPQAIGVIDVSNEVFCAARSGDDWEMLLEKIPKLRLME